MSTDRVLVALLFVLVPGLVLNWSEKESPAFRRILARLQHECDPDNPEADYHWSQRTMPTERKREAIIEDCRRQGLSILPAVRRQIGQESDDEIRAMLVVIAAALGDEDYFEPASQAMVWSDYPAVRITAAKTLRRLHDKRGIHWFLLALRDDHFVVNGGCGLLREQFFPVRVISQIALREILADRYPGDDEILRWSRIVNGEPRWESTFEFEKHIEDLRRLRQALARPQDRH